MSLRLRLTLIFMALLSGVVLLLSIVIYSMISVVMINQADDELQKNANTIIGAMRGDTLGGMDVADETLQISNNIFFQVWSDESQLLAYSENIDEFTGALDAEAFAGDQPIYRNVTIQGMASRVLTVPLTVGDVKTGYLQVAMTIVDIRYTQRLLLVVFSISALFSVIVAGVLSWLVMGQALEPLVMLAQITDRITSTDDLSQRIPVHTTRNDEINRLVLGFNKTLVRLERLFNTQRRFLADVSHELRTPLTVIKGNVGLMRMTNKYDEESLKSIESEVDRLTRLVKDLLLVTQAETGRLPLLLGEVELDDLLFEILKQMKVLSAGKHDIRIESIEPAVVNGDRDRLKQVLLNLGNNAIKFTPKNGCITLNLQIQKHWALITISDEGAGIPTEEQEFLFERFYRGDKSRTRSAAETGFGLGLPIAYWIIHSHGGRIDVKSKVDEGTEFSVWLPLSQKEIPTKPLKDIRGENKSKKP